MSGTVERQAAHFFRITVTESDLKAGIIISCKSTGKDKFKTVFFDNQVGLLSQIESPWLRNDNDIDLGVKSSMLHNF